MDAFVVGLFSEVLGDFSVKVKVNRVHRVGSQPAGKGRRPRDVLAKLHSFKVKDAILQAARRKEEVSFQGVTCMLFQDIAPATLTRRQ